MANQEHLKILKQGVEAWNQWGKDHPEVVADLSKADLRRANLTGVKLIEADLTGANLTRAEVNIVSWADLSGPNLSGVKLVEADLSGANLTGANLTEVNLSGVNLSGANLTGANLTGANLFLANLSRANLTGAKLNHARIGWIVFVGIDLSKVEGLETVNHVRPSTIDIDTIYKSRGKIPEAFLRGAGVPENFIQYMDSLTGRAWEYYSCFISYSTKDQEFADRLYADLQSNGVRCWFAPKDIQGGKKVHEQIDEAIRRYEKLLLILSENSMNSEWVKTEIAKARRRETQEGKRVLFPVGLVAFEKIQEWECFDADTGKDSAREIREYYIPDFQEWKHHDKYKKAFDRLLSDLKSPQPPPRRSD